MKKVFICQSNYIPWKGYFDAINSADTFVMYDDIQYTRRDWRNRNKLKTPQGSQWISIPVEVKGKYLQKINETVVSERNWNRDHWNTIRHNYSRAPYFSEFKDMIEDLYLSCQEDHLSLINYRFLKSICDWMGVKTSFRWSHEFDDNGDRNQRLINICTELGATHYMSGPAAKTYLDENVFEQHGLKVIWNDYSNYPEYPQLFGPFDHAVSIIDLIFNTGSRAKEYCKSFKNEHP